MKNRMIQSIALIGIMLQFASMHPENIISNCNVYGKIFQNGQEVSMIRPSGKKETKQLDIDNIRELVLQGIGHLTLEQCKECPEVLTILADENIMPYLKQDKSRQTLKLSTENVSVTGNAEDLVTYQIVVKDIRSLDLCGATRATTHNMLNVDNLRLDMSGASQFDGSINTNNLHSDISGASQVNLQGTAYNQTVDISGASIYNAKNLVSNTTNIDVAGASQAQINATKKIIYDASGASRLDVFGNPNTSGDRSGVAQVRKH
jgi:hypothetical protein